MAAKSFAIESMFGVALGWFFAGSAVIAGPTGLIDDFNDADLSQYTQTLVLDQNLTSNVSFVSPSGALQVSKSAGTEAEQMLLLRDDFTLAVGETLQVDLNYIGTSRADIGIAVAATASPTPLVYDAVAGGTQETREDYAAVYVQADGDNLKGIYVDGTTAGPTIFAGGFGSLAAGDVLGLYIRRDSLNDFALGYTTADGDSDFATQSLANTNIGDAVGIFGDVRSVTTFGDLDNLRILPPPPPPVGPTLTIDRDTGEMQLSNDGIAAQVFSYTVSSPTAGALNPANWQSVTDNWDFDSGSVGNYFDPDDTDGFGNGWLESSATVTQWAEGSSSIFLGDGGLLDDGTNCDVCPLQIGLADAWTKSIYEDVEGTFTVAGVGSPQDLIVKYVGNGDEPFARSDLSFTNGVGPEDWTIFIANHLGDFTGMTQAQAYQLGDLDGDFDNDYDDWLLFGQDYDAANGAGAFAALLAGTVPEPNTALLTALGLAGLACVRRGRSRAQTKD